MSLKFTGVFHRPNALSIYTCRQAGGKNVKDWGVLFGSQTRFPVRKMRFLFIPKKKYLQSVIAFEIQTTSHNVQGYNQQSISRSIYRGEICSISCCFIVSRISKAG